MIVGSLVLLVIVAAVLVAIWPTVTGLKSIRLKDGKSGALELGKVKAEVGVSYLASQAPEVSYLITRDGKLVAEGRYRAGGMSGTFDIFSREASQDNVPFLLSGEVVGNRMKITLEKKICRA